MLKLFVTFFISFVIFQNYFLVIFYDFHIFVELLILLMYFFSYFVECLPVLSCSLLSFFKTNILNVLKFFFRQFLDLNFYYWKIICSFDSVMFSLIFWGVCLHMCMCVCVCSLCLDVSTFEGAVTCSRLYGMVSVSKVLHLNLVLRMPSGLFLAVPV